MSDVDHGKSYDLSVVQCAADSPLLIAAAPLLVWPTRQGSASDQT